MLIERHFSYLHHPDAKSDDKSDDYNWQNSSNYYANKCQQASSYKSPSATAYA